MFNPYQVKTEFTVWEAAAAILGIKRNHSDDFPEIQPVAIELIRSIERDQLKARPLVPSNQYVIITMANGMQGDVDGVYFAAIQRADLLAWCESRRIRPSLLFPDQAQPNVPPAASPDFQTVLRDTGKRHATLQHTERNRLYLEVVALARQRWEEGEQRQHFEMAKHFLALPEYSNLAKGALLKRLKELARDMKRLDLIRGLKKTSPG